MPLSEFYKSTIIEVSATFGFCHFDCDADVVTRALQIQPTNVLRKGGKRTIRGNREIEDKFNSWCIKSASASKDVNVHIRELLSRIEGKQGVLDPAFGHPSFSVLWKGNYLYAGSGPFYEADVIQGIASWGAELWQDIYQIDQEDNPPIGELGLRRL